MGSEPWVPPSPYLEILERVMAADKAYFDDHPDSRSYTRDYVPGEFWPMDPPEGAMVKVTYVGPGVRLREPFLVITVGRTRNN